MAAGARFGGRHIFRVVQRGHHAFHSTRIEVRQEQMHIVERGILFDTACQRCAHHPAQQLGDVGVVLRTAERHHHFGARAIPAGGQAGLEEHHTDVFVRINPRGFHLAHPAAAHIQIACVVHRMGDLSLFQATTNGAFDHRQRCAEVGLGQLPF